MLRPLALLAAHAAVYYTLYSRLDIDSILHYDVLETQRWSFQVYVRAAVAAIVLSVLVTRVVNWAVKNHRKRIRASRPRVVPPSPRRRGPRPEFLPPAPPTTFHDPPAFVPSHPASRLLYDPTPRAWHHHEPEISTTKQPDAKPRRLKSVLDMRDYTPPRRDRFLPPGQRIKQGSPLAAADEGSRPTIPLRRGHATSATHSSRPATTTATLGRYHVLPTASPFLHPILKGEYRLPPIAPRRFPPLDALIPEPITSPRGPPRGLLPKPVNPQYATAARRSPPPPNRVRRSKPKPKLSLFAAKPTPDEHTAESVRARERKMARARQLALEQEMDDDDERRRRVPRTHDNADSVTEQSLRKSTSAARNAPQKKTKARPYPETKSLLSSLEPAFAPAHDRATHAPGTSGTSALAGTTAPSAARKARKTRFVMPGAMPSGAESHASGSGSKGSDVPDDRSVAAELEKRVAKIVKKADTVGKKARRADDTGAAPAAAPTKVPSTRRRK
ncbi:uncharacterized protein LOC62_05G007149 [Vanrija pseudolonga]|uniref:Uncharacterized protein n=1 Tax=Vanrija pseudolonga TaxID=143232 RepID=A0AAF0YEV2_9TREE|nr:hypothetical protein LOC62_05G007149 [Vanrija pseudolonga]